MDSIIIVEIIQSLVIIIGSPIIVLIVVDIRNKKSNKLMIKKELYNNLRNKIHQAQLGFYKLIFLNSDDIKSSDLSRVNDSLSKDLEISAPLYNLKDINHNNILIVYNGLLSTVFSSLNELGPLILQNKLIIDNEELYKLLSELHSIFCERFYFYPVRFNLQQDQDNNIDISSDKERHEECKEKIKKINEIIDNIIGK